MDKFTAAAVTLCALRRAPDTTVNIVQTPTAVTIESVGFTLGNKLYIQGYESPKTIQEIHDMATAQCEREFPEKSGWTNHRINLAAFNPAEFAAEVESIQVK